MKLYIEHAYKENECDWYGLKLWSRGRSRRYFSSTIFGVGKKGNASDSFK